FDGHEFIEDALSKGAVAVVVERGKGNFTGGNGENGARITNGEQPTANGKSPIANSRSLTEGNEENEAGIAKRQQPTANGKSQMGPSPAFLAVEDTRKALGRLAAEYRKDFAMPIVAIAGSNGKTTTKELVAS